MQTNTRKSAPGHKSPASKAPPVRRRKPATQKGHRTTHMSSPVQRRSFFRRGPVVGSLIAGVLLALIGGFSTSERQRRSIWKF